MSAHGDALPALRLGGRSKEPIRLDPVIPERDLKRQFDRYFAYSFLLAALNVMGFLRFVDWRVPAAAVFSIAAALSYAALYLLPAYLPSRLVLALAGTRRRACIALTAVSTVAVVQWALFFDQMLFARFGFHWNGFVWNLLTTRGGLESMGADTATGVSIGLLSLLPLLLQAALWRLARTGRAAS